MNRATQAKGEVTFVAAQLGARMHYAVPRILYAAGMLERLCTDLVAVRGWPYLVNKLGLLTPLGAAGARMAARVPEGIPPHKVTQWPAFALEYHLRQRRARSVEELTAVHLWAGREFCRRIIQRGLGGSAGIYVFNSAGLELLEYARARELFCAMEQTIAPVQILEDLLAEELSLHPGWETPESPGPFRREFAARERAEWQLAHLIVCGSEFVRQSIAQSGGPVDRCVVVPYGVDLPVLQRNRVRANRLRVLIAGQVGLRKGAPYVLQAARSLHAVAEFRWCGPIGLLPEATRLLAEHVDLRGPMPRGQMAEHYAWADVFLLASLCEGSATVCYEALAAGLPVITTPNAGSVVRDGIEGFIVPIRDAEAIIDRVERLARDRNQLEWMSARARERAKEFTVACYGQRLLSVLLRDVSHESHNSGS